METKMYGEKNIPGGYQLKTIRQLYGLLDKKCLTEEDVETIRGYRGTCHGFNCERTGINGVSSGHYNEPKSVFFLDIKGTIYRGGTHYNGGLGYLLGRSPQDSDYISCSDITALGKMIDRTRPQEFTIPYYKFNNGYRIVPDKVSSDISLVKLPTNPMAKMRTARCPSHETKNGPFCVVFVSSDDVETQKNIISLLYYMYLFDEKRRINYVIQDSRATEIDIIAIEKLLRDKYNNNFMSFLECENKKFANLSSEEITEFKNTINGLFFKSTCTGKTKVQLMDEFLESDIRREKVGPFYNVFALGDSLSDDGGMILNAFLSGGFGFIRESYDTISSDLLMETLHKNGIELPFLPTAWSFSSFYDTVVKTLVEQRENELIDAMTWANTDCGVKQIFNKSGTILYLKKEK